MKPVPHGEPYAGKLHVRFDEGYPPKNGEARFEGSRRPSGRTLRGRLALLYTLFLPDPVPRETLFLALARWAGKIGWQVRLAAATARGEPGTLRVPKAPA